MTFFQVAALALLGVFSLGVAIACFEAWLIDRNLRAMRAEYDDARQDYLASIRAHVRTMPLDVIAPALGLADRRAEEQAGLDSRDDWTVAP